MSKTKWTLMILFVLVLWPVMVLAGLVLLIRLAWAVGDDFFGSLLEKGIDS